MLKMPFQSVDYDGLSDTSMEVPIMFCDDPAFYKSIAHSNPFYDSHQPLWDRSPEIGYSPTRRSRSPHKKLFGENGWLGHSPSVKEQSNKKAGLKTLGEKIKHHVGEIAGDVAKASSIHFRQDSAHSKIISRSSLPTSVDPPTQAKLYSEMEVMICVSANKFLVQQYEEGRMSADSINKITSFWMSKNRPRVPEFQFDQSTQREIILQNLRMFQFYGECSTNPVALSSTLHNWKAVAKEMSVRTFCAPDSVIRKHMHDVYKILEMLGAPLVTALAFQDLQMQTLALMQEHLKKNPQHNGASSTTRGYRRT
ncbi:hypothetical protein VTN02DRAFT_5739 [Thermoascus thermophilus]